VGGIGLTLAQARAKLATYFLRATVVYLETADYPPDQVIYQNPAAGAEVQKNSAVELTVSKEMPSTTTTTEPTTTTTTTVPSSTTTTTAPF
jgi:beta-lactam-binding protein with PASTA domain